MDTLPTEINALAIETLAQFDAAGAMISTAESCTGGLIAAALTEIAGSSSVVERGFVTYSNDAKTELLNVPADMIAAKGAVSAEVAEAMAMGALSRSKADVAVAVTGVAGPGQSENKPAGLVYIASVRRGGAPLVSENHFKGDRGQVRRETVIAALKQAASHLG